MDAYARLNHQAELQVYERETGKQRSDPLEPAFDRGFALLPEPDPADVFFDMEGDPYLGAHGLEYLFGVEYADENGEWAFRSWWATEPEREQAALESFVDWVMARWRDIPGLHVYHYGHYEPTALSASRARTEPERTSSMSCSATASS